MHYLSTNKTLIQKQSVKKYVYMVYSKYQIASVKALVQVDFPVHVLSEH